MERFFEITSLGRKFAGSVSSQNRNVYLDELREVKRASTEQLAAMTGTDKWTVLREMKKLERSSLVQEVGNGHF